MKTKTRRKAVAKVVTASKKLKDDEITFYRVQGMSLTFFKVLKKSEDHELIYTLFKELMSELELNDLEETLIFSFIKMNSELLEVSVKDLVDKLLWVLTENDEDELTVSWLKDQSFKLL